MDEDIGKLMDEVLISGLEGLKTMKPGQEKTNEVENLTKLYKARSEQAKMEFDCDEKREKLKMEVEKSADESIDRSRDEAFRAQQLAEQKKERYLKYGLLAVETISGVVFAWVWTGYGFAFEEDNVHSSKTFAKLDRFVHMFKKKN